MKIQKITFIYIVILGLAAFLNEQFPSQIAVFVDFFFHSTIDLESQAFIRYRMVLFIVASVGFLLFVPLVFRVGLLGLNHENIKRVHWRHIAVLAFAVPLIWIGYPFISLCPTCWTANDIFYFLLTVSVFVGLQISSHAVLLKMFR